ncbi:hypothetical protein LPJ73_002039, partial [Coemansia sp. RSA 2703]
MPRTRKYSKIFTSDISQPLDSTGHVQANPVNVSALEVHPETSGSNAGTSAGGSSAEHVNIVTDEQMLYLDNIIILEKEPDKDYRERHQRHDRREAKGKQSKRRTKDNIPKLSVKKKRSQTPAQQPAHESVRQPLEAVQTTIQSSGTNQAQENPLLSLPTQHRLKRFSTLEISKNDYIPRRALMHQFNNRDRQTVLAYGIEELELWDPIDKNLLGMLNGDWDNLRIEQVEPVSPSVLAIISAGVKDKQQVIGGGKLHFTKVDWSTGNDQFPKMPIQEWTEDTQSGMSISIIEGIESAVTNDETRVSLFTGDTTNGFVYRRIFDISENKVAKVGEQRM